VLEVEAAGSAVEEAVSDVLRDRTLEPTALLRAGVLILKFESTWRARLVT